MSPEPPIVPQRGVAHDGWGTLRRFLPYLWPSEQPGLRLRIVLAGFFVLVSMALSMSLAFFLKWAIDAMTLRGPAALQLAMPGWWHTAPGGSVR